MWSLERPRGAVNHPGVRTGRGPASTEAGPREQEHETGQGIPAGPAETAPTDVAPPDTKAGPREDEQPIPARPVENRYRCGSFTGTAPAGAPTAAAPLAAGGRAPGGGPIRPRGRKNVPIKVAPLNAMPRMQMTVSACT